MDTLVLSLAAQNDAVGHTNCLIVAVLPKGVAGVLQLPPLYTDTSLVLPPLEVAVLLAAQNDAVGHTNWLITSL